MDLELSEMNSNLVIKYIIILNYVKLHFYQMKHFIIKYLT